jgi:hypothetical protein
MADLLRPQDLKKIADDAEMATIQAHLSSQKKAEDEQAQLREAFMTREIHPQVGERLNAAVKRAAESGRHEIQIFTFPASFCNDQGRRINNMEADWPASLEGFARKAYDYFEEKLKPLGYRMRVQILNYPGGMPGEVGVFLGW